MHRLVQRHGTQARRNLDEWCDCRRRGRGGDNKRQAEKAGPDKIMVVVEEGNARTKEMKVGADVVVMKPITAETVVQKVNDMLLQTESFLERKRAKFQRRK